MELWKQTSLTSIQWVKAHLTGEPIFWFTDISKKDGNYWKWMGELLLFFFVHWFFPMDRGNATDARIFSVGTQFLFSGAGDAMQKKESGQVESLVPEVPMHVNVEAALTEFLTCHPWRCEHHFAQSWTAHFHRVNPTVQDNLTLRSRNLREIGQRWPVWLKTRRLQSMTGRSRVSNCVKLGFPQEQQPICLSMKLARCCFEFWALLLHIPSHPSWFLNKLHQCGWNIIIHQSLNQVRLQWFPLYTTRITSTVTSGPAIGVFPDIRLSSLKDRRVPRGSPSSANSRSPLLPGRTALVPSRWWQVHEL